MNQRAARHPLRRCFTIQSCAGHTGCRNFRSHELNTVTESQRTCCAIHLDEFDISHRESFSQLVPHLRARNIGVPVAFRSLFCRCRWIWGLSGTWLEHRESPTARSQQRERETHLGLQPLKKALRSGFSAAMTSTLRMWVPLVTSSTGPVRRCCAVHAFGRACLPMLLEHGRYTRQACSPSAEPHPHDQAREARRVPGLHALHNSVCCSSDACRRIIGGSLDKMSPPHSTQFLVRLSFIGVSHTSRVRQLLQCSAGPEWYGCHGTVGTLASTYAPAVGRPSESAGCLAGRKKVIRKKQLRIAH